MLRNFFGEKRRFWDYFLSSLSKSEEIIVKVVQTTCIRSSDGRGRALIRHALTSKKLAEIVQVMHVTCILLSLVGVLLLLFKYKDIYFIVFFTYIYIYI